MMSNSASAISQSLSAGASAANSAVSRTSLTTVEKGHRADGYRSQVLPLLLGLQVVRLLLKLQAWVWSLLLYLDTLLDEWKETEESGGVAYTCGPKVEGSRWTLEGRWTLFVLI